MADPMLPTATFDLVIVGLGSGGLTAAEFAAGLGLRVAAVEQARVGGDCLWTGCVPSKALLASARVAHTIRTADRYGIGAAEPHIDLATVWRRVRAVQAQIAATDDNPEHLREAGIQLYRGTARLTGPNEVAVRPTGDGPEQLLTTRFVLLCTGSRPHIPPIAGLSTEWCLTSDNLFQIDQPPARLAVIGGGPMGVEMAQALTRLGVQVTVLQRAPTLLPREEPALVERLAAVLTHEGVAVHYHADVRKIAGVAANGPYVVHAIVGHEGSRVQVEVDGVLVAAGRTATTNGLGLEALGIAVSGQGIAVDERGRTAVRTVYAAGDVAGRRLLTNTAGYEAVRAVRDMFFPGKGTVDALQPWCTFTDPELAHAGLTVAEAEELYGTDTDVWQLDLAHNDRARADGRTEGAMVVITAKGRVVGAHVLAPAAGELIHELALAIHRGMRLADLAELVHVYPTLASSIGRLATEAAYEKALRLRWLMKRK
ncbi:MAG: FAD-dependent oxidoreductase [Actinomycetota bacterium]|nr:FAD-dependent oxidoreductase [Actinomycetota bacterium]